jgi:hypothetical protein
MLALVELDLADAGREVLRSAAGVVLRCAIWRTISVLRDAEIVCKTIFLAMFNLPL